MGGIDHIPQTYRDAVLRHIWTYLDPEGEALAIVARYDRQDGKKEIVPYRPNGSGWKPGALPEPRPLFGLDKLAAADPSKSVAVVEEEKAAAALQSLGLVAVTSQGGSNAVRKTSWKSLAGRIKVYILADNDKAGEKYARDVAAILEALESPLALPFTHKYHWT